MVLENGLNRPYTVSTWLHLVLYGYLNRAVVSLFCIQQLLLSYNYHIQCWTNGLWCDYNIITHSGYGSCVMKISMYIVWCHRSLLQNANKIFTATPTHSNNTATFPLQKKYIGYIPKVIPIKQNIYLYWPSHTSCNKKTLLNIAKQYNQWRSFISTLQALLQ